jgi:hypothetical protein
MGMRMGPVATNIRGTHTVYSMFARDIMRLLRVIYLESQEKNYLIRHVDVSIAGTTEKEKCQKPVN